MSLRSAFSVLLAAVFALTLSVAAFASEPCEAIGLIYCQGQDGTGLLYASQNDTTGGFGNFATVYDNFTFTRTYDIYSFHWVGGYFDPEPPSNITAWTLTFYNDNAGAPGAAIATESFGGNGHETLLANGLYEYYLDFVGVPMAPGTYWASVVPDQNFPPQWGWATSTQGDGVGHQCYFGSCGAVATDFAFGIDTPEPGSLLLLGSGLLGAVGVVRRKITA